MKLLEAFLIVISLWAISRYPLLLVAWFIAELNNRQFENKVEPVKLSCFTFTNSMLGLVAIIYLIIK